MKRKLILSICMMVGMALFAQTGTDSIPVTELDEIEVAAVRNFVKPLAGGIKVSMTGNPLSEIGTAIDAIKQMPMINASAGGIEVTGRGVPVYYINGRMVRNMSELEILSSKDLDSVEIISDPSSKYGSDVKAVILIRTKKRTEGMHASFASSLTAAEKMSEAANGSIGYRTENGLYAFGDFSVEESRFKQTRHYATLIFESGTDKSAYSDTYMTGHNRTRSLSADGGMTFDFGKHSVGAKYTFTRTPSMRFRSNSITNTDMSAVEEITSSADILSDNFQHYLNFFLYLELPKSISMRIDSDYIHNGNASTNLADEQQTDISIENIGINRSDMFASKIELEKTFDAFTLSGGCDFTFTDHRQNFESNSTGDSSPVLQSATDDVTQQLYSGFLSFDWKLADRFMIYGGVRYDGTRTKYVRNGIQENDLSKSYADILPNIGIQFRSPVTIYLSFRHDVYRPSYSSLSNKYTYVTPTNWETGDPALMKMKARTLSLNLSYRKLMFQAQATNYDRKIGLSYRFDPVINATVSQTLNLPTYNMLQLVAVQQLDIRRWHPTLQGVMVFQNLKYGDPQRSYTTPFYQCSLNNRFDLPHSFYAYLSFFVRGTGNIETQYCGATCQTALTISKKLGNWNFNLTANDIFGTWRQKVCTITNNVNHSYNIKGASQYISLSVRYQFKSAKKAYSGKSVRKDEINRL